MSKRESKAKRILVVPDLHYAPRDDKEGGHDERAVSVALQAIEIIKPTTVVMLGDVGEWSSVNHHITSKVGKDRLATVLERLERDGRSVNAGLDKWGDAIQGVGCDDVHLLLGNHEQWVAQLCEEFPVLHLTHHPINLLRLVERGWRSYDYGDYLKLGKLAFTHGGHFGGQHHAYRTLVGTGKSVIYGHFHTIQSTGTPRLMVIGGRGAWGASPSYVSPS